MSTTLRHLRVLSVAILLTSAFWSLPRGVMGQAPIPTATRTPTPINVGNFVWDDLDGDGRQDAGEPGLAGITVHLWNGTKTQLIGSVVTNASGNCSLVVPVPGDYRVRVVKPPINDQFSPKDNAAAGDTLDSDINPSGVSLGFTDIYTFGTNLISITSIDAGLMIFRTPTPTRTPTPINVGNFVWHDLDVDGRQDAGEPGLGGITVQLWNGAETQLIDQKVTNASGNYSLVAPVPGDYRVRVVLPSASDQFSPKDNAAAGDTLDSDINPSGASLGFTDVYTFASNLISITSIDTGLKTVSPTRTPTATATRTRTPTPSQTTTLTRTPSPTATDADTHPNCDTHADTHPNCDTHADAHRDCAGRAHAHRDLCVHTPDSCGPNCISAAGTPVASSTLGNR